MKNLIHIITSQGHKEFREMYNKNLYQTRTRTVNIWLSKSTYTNWSVPLTWYGYHKYAYQWYTHEQINLTTYIYELHIFDLRKIGCEDERHMVSLRIMPTVEASGQVTTI